MPSALIEDTQTEGYKSHQDFQQSIRSGLLAAADSRIDLETAISLIQQLKKTASPGELIALRK
jgi:hypothetical protein